MFKYTFKKVWILTTDGWYCGKIFCGPENEAAGSKLLDRDQADRSGRQQNIQEPHHVHGPLWSEVSSSFAFQFSIIHFIVYSIFQYNLIILTSFLSLAQSKHLLVDNIIFDIMFWVFYVNIDEKLSGLPFVSMSAAVHCCFLTSHMFSDLPQVGFLQGVTSGLKYKAHYAVTKKNRVVVSFSQHFISLPVSAQSPTGNGAHTECAPVQRHMCKNTPAANSDRFHTNSETYSKLYIFCYLFIFFN